MWHPSLVCLPGLVGLLSLILILSMTWSEMCMVHNMQYMMFQNNHMLCTMNVSLYAVYTSFHEFNFCCP